MRNRLLLFVLVLGVAVSVSLVVRSRRAVAAYADVQKRGATVMGVDQYTSQHVFEDLPTGGRIALDRDNPSDTAAITTIRAHMQEIAAAFRIGDFSKPFVVHDQTVPGTDVMHARHDQITYTVVERPRGAEVDISTSDTAAITAVHVFLAFQRSDHHAAGHEHMPGMTMDSPGKP
jgi:hypothetical protein